MRTLKPTFEIGYPYGLNEEYPAQLLQLTVEPGGAGIVQPGEYDLWRIPAAAYQAGIVIQYVPDEEPIVETPFKLKVVKEKSIKQEDNK